MPCACGRAASSGSKGYPLPDELARFGREVCGVKKPADVLGRIAGSLHDTLAAAQADERMPGALIERMRPVWEAGMAFASDSG